jgi:glycosyltransferase involved in cell wall biosynthesis
MLRSLADQSRRPDQVVIVDSSAEPVQSVAEEFGQLNVKYIHVDRPSASGQRNTGIRAVDEGMDLIAFMDDDAVLEPGSLEAMLDFWASAPADMGGAAFNWLNFQPTGGGWLKRSAPCRWLGLYSPVKGQVMPSGWQTLAGIVSETTLVQWLPSGASVWRKQIFEKFCFDEFFDGYSYLEDLDFSFSVGRHYKLAVVAGAGFKHYPSPAGRSGMVRFGKVEVRNRLYFVRKHGLSVPRCYLGLMIRLLMTLAGAFALRWRQNLGRALGNVIGLLQSIAYRPGKGLGTGGKVGPCSPAAQSR